MQETAHINKTADEPYEHIPYSVGRQYVMDWRNKQELHSPAEVIKHTEDEETPETLPEEPPTPETNEAETEEIATAEYSPRISDSRERSRRPDSVNIRLWLCLIMAVTGTAAGAVIATAFPLENAELSLSVAADTAGGFWGVLSRRLALTGAFLLAEYVLGYFAAGGIIVWAVPLCCGLGTGLSAAGICMSGVNIWLLIPIALYCAVIAFAASASGEFSSLILRLLNSRGETLTSGGYSYRYTLRFGVYLVIILAAAIAEAAGKLAAV